MGNKTAVITGGSRGIGRTIALMLAEAQINIAIIYSSNTEAADAVCAEARAQGVKAEAYRCNVADFEQTSQICQEIAKEFGGVDILVNNAGITKDNLLLRMSEADYDDVLNVNLKSAFNFTKHLSRYIMRSPAGRIINITSVSGLSGNIGQTNYSASKAGMIGLTKTIAREFAGKNVTCNAVAPGFIETDMTEALPQSVKDNATNMIPLKRMGKPEEVAALVSFLASDAAAYITGEVIRVDGGMCT